MTVRVGVIGAGVMGTEHAGLLDREVSGVQLQAIFDIDSAQDAAVASQRRARGRSRIR
jgi:myo-inositol 2-dehydrogenase/D-chiro-inositol 1-dehydrogenase